jgi:hypothetical protein
MEKVVKTCNCVCGCDYKLDGYQRGEVKCGACLDNCQNKIDKRHAGTTNQGIKDYVSKDIESQNYNNGRNN